MRIGLLRAGANAAMPRPLVIQPGRLGDVVQTTPLFSDLAAHGDEVDALILRSAHEPLLGFSAVANIITITDSLKPLDDAISGGFRQGKIPVEADELLTGLQLPRYDRIVNASHAPLGCWLAGAIPCTNADARSGGIICDRECLYRGPANVYRVAQLQFREQNLFHVVDLLRGAWEAEPKRKRPRLYTNRAADLRFALPQGRVAGPPKISRASPKLFARPVLRQYSSGHFPITSSANKSDRLLASPFQISRGAQPFQKWPRCWLVAIFSCPPTPVVRTLPRLSAPRFSASMAPQPGSPKRRPTATTISSCKRRSTRRCLRFRSKRFSPPHCIDSTVFPSTICAANCTAKISLPGKHWCNRHHARATRSAD